MRWFRTTAVRFLIVGGANTAATGALVVLLSLVWPGWLAFSVSFALGIVFSVAMTGRWVFQSALSSQRGALFAAAYVVIYLLGLGIIQLADMWKLPPVANAATVFITAPLSFLAGRLIFTDHTERKVG